MRDKYCITCGNNTLTTFIDLGLQPNVNRFARAHTTYGEKVFPISMLVCRTCWQVQLSDFLPPEYLFRHNPYITGVNEPIVRHFQMLVPHMIQKFKLAQGSLVLDIGCNDGTLLKIFADHGMSALGIDPGVRTANLAKNRGISVIRKFWNERTADILVARGVFPDLITATAVFYHVPDLHDFVKGIKKIMKHKTVFMVQCLYLKDVIEKNQFENIYHEHRAIHAVAPLKALFESHGLRLIDVEFSDVHGGSFILYIGLPNHPMATSMNIHKAVQREREARLFTIGTYNKFTKRVNKNIQELRSVLLSLQKDGKRVYALGASAKGAMLLNAAHITKDLLKIATEVNEFKIGRVTPGSHVPIVDEKSVTTDPDYYLILSWNYLEYFIQKYNGFLRRGGKFIVPIPTVHIISK